MAAWVEAARSASTSRGKASTGTAWAAASFLACVITAVFSPAKEKSRLPLCSSGRGSLKAAGSPCSASLRQRRPAGVAQAHELGGFVKRLAGRVVDGFAQDFVAAHAVHPHQLGVAARDQQRDKREFRRIGTQERRQQMPLQVVHAQHRPLQRGAQRAGHARAHQQRAGQARAARVGHHIHVAQRSPGLGQHLLGQRQHAADMVAARQLGHHAAIGLVHLDLAVQGVRAQHRHPDGRGLPPAPRRFRRTTIQFPISA